MEKIPLPRYSECFVCGNQNPVGLDVTFYYADGIIQTEFTPGPSHTGYRDVVHGGILATLLDECMGWTSILSRKVMCTTAELTIRYKQSAKAGEPLLVQAALENDRKRVVLTSGKVVTRDGTVLCTGEGKYIPLPVENQQQVVAYAEWGGALEDVYRRIQASMNGSS